MQHMHICIVTIQNREEPKKMLGKYVNLYAVLCVFFNSFTCQHYSHECVSQERVVDKVPEPLEVGKDVVNHRGTGLQH